MDGVGHDQHPDMAAEVGQRLGQGLAVLATLGEAAARLAAEEMHRRQRREEQTERFQERLRTEQAREERRKLREVPGKRRTGLPDEVFAEQRRAARRDRRLIAQTLDPKWLARADLLDLATVWRTARLRENEFPEARIAAEEVEQRLREVYPRPMVRYDQAVAGCVSRAEAMRVAAWQMARTRPARSHGGSRFPAVGPGPQPAAGANAAGVNTRDVNALVANASGVNGRSAANLDTHATDRQGADALGADVEAFEAAVHREQARLADLALPAGYAEDLERLGAVGRGAAQALREALAAQAGQELRHGQADAATPDDPTTAGVDEHTTIGLPRNARHLGDADRDRAGARTAAQLAAEWYPEGLCPPTVMPAHVAGRRPANARTRTAGGERKPVRAR